MPMLQRDCMDTFGSLDIIYLMEKHIVAHSFEKFQCGLDTFHLLIVISAALGSICE